MRSARMLESAGSARPVRAGAHQVSQRRSRRAGESLGRKWVAKLDTVVIHVRIHAFRRDGIDQAPGCFFIRGGARRKRGSVNLDGGPLGQGFAVRGSRGKSERQDDFISQLACGKIGDGSGNDGMPRDGIAGGSAAANKSARARAERKQDGCGGASRSLRHRSIIALEDVPAEVLILHDVGQLLARRTSPSTLTFFFFRSGASKEISSSTFSMMVCRRRAPMFSVCSFTRDGEARDLFQGVLGELQLDAFGFEQRHVLLDQRVLRFGQNADEILLGQRLSTPRGWESGPAVRESSRWACVTWNAPAAMNRM